jgi:Flp pilus assembly protein TadG
MDNLFLGLLYKLHIPKQFISGNTMMPRIIRRKARRERKAQSFVEFAIFLPIFLIMISGLTEFGFLLNEYLNLIDGPREGARWASDQGSDNSYQTGGSPFYINTAGVALKSIEPIDSNVVRATGDVVISVFSIDNTGHVTARYPTGSPNGYSTFNNYTSRFTNAQVEARINGASLTPISTGIVLVEIYYNYSQLLKLPWITLFVPDPILVYSYTMMPCMAAQPPYVPTP